MGSGGVLCGVRYGIQHATSLSPKLQLAEAVCCWHLSPFGM